ncbi:MAG: permease-like cell division protein FtsX [Candidatus Obscuribacterales bacterium]|nr:permease-like cell division protein FtsX [Candidatus Obscuribacterales bacterium]
MRQLRIFYRVLVETFLGLKHSGWSNWLVVSILAIALTIFGSILQLTMTLKNVVNSFGSQMVISAYLDNNHEPRNVAREVSQFAEVRLVEVVTKDVAWEDMKKNLKVASIPNPLPNTLHITVYNPEQVEKLAPKLKLLPAVEAVKYPLMVARRINEIRHFFEIAGVAVTAALTTATLTVIGNTIHLVIQARKREIEILSLMGVGHFYIKCPFVIQGAIYGTIAACIAMVVLITVQLYVVQPYMLNHLVSFASLLPQQLEYSLVQTFMVMLLLGVAVGAGGGAWTSGRYIKI